MKRSIFAGCLAVMLMLSLATALLPPSAFATPQMGGSEEPAGAAEERGRQGSAGGSCRRDDCGSAGEQAL